MVEQSSFSDNCNYDHCFLIDDDIVRLIYVTHVLQYDKLYIIKLLSCWQRPRFPLQYYNGKLELTANVANVTVELIKT